MTDEKLLKYHADSLAKLHGIIIPSDVSFYEGLEGPVSSENGVTTWKDIPIEYINRALNWILENKYILEQVLERKEVRMGDHPMADFLKHIIKNGTLKHISTATANESMKNGKEVVIVYYNDENEFRYSARLLPDLVRVEGIWDIFPMPIRHCINQIPEDYGFEYTLHEGIDKEEINRLYEHFLWENF